MEQVNAANKNISEVLRRRAPIAAVVAGVLLLITISLALGLPAIYKSRAVLLIEAQEIPQDFVRSLDTGYADQRIQIISQRVLTNANLREIIQKHGLYAEELESDSMEVVLEQMRDDIIIDPISADVVDERSGRPIKATIAIELAYKNKQPQISQRVTNELVSLFLNENLKQRTESVEETLSFLQQEADKLREHVAKLEEKLADFKERNAGQLPELTNLNIQLLNSREQDLVQLDTQIQSLEEHRVYLESELAQQQPTSQLYSERGERILGPKDRLKVLESEFVPVAARYGDKHPDVVAKRKEIDALREEIGVGPNGGDIANRLKGKQTTLTTALKRYGADHPDVIRLTKEVDLLRGQLAEANAARGVYTPPANEVPDNPVYVRIWTRLEGTRSEIAALRARKSSIRAKIDELEQRIINSPQVEREYRMLTRDYTTAQAKYQEVLAKSQEADLAQSLQSDQKGERLSLIEPPAIPEEPYLPNRLALGFLGFVFSIGSGVGVGLAAESLDSRIYGRSGVMRLLDVPPLAVIPKIENAATARRRLQKHIVLLLLVLVILLGVAAALHLLYRPLDVLFYQVLRVIGF